MIKTIKLSTYRYSTSTDSTGLDKIAKALKEKNKNKKSFWGPIAKKTIATGKEKGWITGGIDFALSSSKTFPEFKNTIILETENWFAPVAESYERYGRELTKDIAKKLKIKVIE